MREFQVDYPDWALPLLEEGRYRYKILYGGRGGGKSWQVAIALVALAARKKLRIGCFREVQNSIKDSVHQLLVDQIQRIGLEGFEVRIDKITHANGSKFTFKGLRDQKTSQSIKSYESLDIAWVEEAQAVSDESWGILIPTIRKAKSEIWITFNPRLETDYVWQWFVKNPQENSYVKKVNLPQNPFASNAIKQESERLKQNDIETWHHIYGGEPVLAIEGVIYEKEIIALQREGRFCKINIDTNLPVHTVWDLGYSDDTAIGLVQRVGSELRFLHYIEGRGLPLEEYIKRLEECRVNGIMFRWGVDILPHDSTAKTLNAPFSVFERLRRDFNRRPISLTQAKDIEIEISYVRSEFKNVYINETCTELLEHIKNYRRVISKYGETRPCHDEHSHAADMLRYAIVGQREMRNEEMKPIKLQFKQYLDMPSMEY